MVIAWWQDEQGAAGAGASTGIIVGLGHEVDVAINHDGEALAVHGANHPTTAHYIEYVLSVQPNSITRPLPIGLILLQWRQIGA